MTIKQKHRTYFLIPVSLQLLLLVIYLKIKEEYIQLIICMLLVLSFLNFLFARGLFENSENIYERWYIPSIFKYLFITLLYFLCKKIAPNFLLLKSFLYLFIFIALDVIRISLCCTISKNFEDRLSTFYFNDLLKLEFFILLAVIEESKEKEKCKLKLLNYEKNIYSFYEKGKPDPLNVDLCFELWSNPSLSLKANYRLFVEEKLGLHKNSQGTLKDFSNQDDEFSTKNRKNNSEFIRKNELIKCFDIHGSFLFNSIAYLRAEESLDKTTFKENMSEILKERDAFFVSIEKTFRLINRVRLFGYIFHLVFFVSLMILYPSTGTLIFVFLISFCIYLVRPSLGRNLEASFYILFSNPYSVNDRIKYKNEVFIVKDMSFLSTIFQKWCGEICTINNETVSKDLIFNNMRSFSQQWEVSFLVSNKIDIKDFDRLRKIIKNYCASSNAILSVKINLNEIVDSNFYRLVIHVKHLMNFQSPFFMWLNQNNFMKFLLSYLKSLKINYIPIDKEIEEIR